MQLCACVVRAIKHHLRYSAVEVQSLGYCFGAWFYGHKWPELSTNQRKQAHATIVKSIHPKRDDQTFVSEVIRPLYDKWWRDELIKGKMHAELLDLATFLLEKQGPSVALVFDQSLAQHELGRFQEAEHGYKGVLKLSPDNASALHTRLPLN